RACLAQVEQQLGRLDAAETWLAGVPRDTGDFYQTNAHADQARYRRDLAALTALTEPAMKRNDAELTGVDFAVLMRLGQLQGIAGHAGAAHATFERVVHAIAVGELDHDAFSGPQIPLVYAGVGDYPKALAAARQGVDRNRNDSLELAASTIVLAQVLAQ